jgi:hypothetical protein
MSPTSVDTLLVRLQAAFTSLEACHYFTDMGSQRCLADAVDALPFDMPFALITQQDLAGLQSTGVLDVGFGASDEHGESLGRQDLAAVGRQVQQALIQHGLPALWDGNPDCCISLITSCYRD